MICYIVVQKGVYRHDIFGPFENPGAAKICAAEAEKTERDHYHDYQVVKLQSGEEAKIVIVASWEWTKHPFSGPPGDPRNTKGKGHLIWEDPETGEQINAS